MLVASAFVPVASIALPMQPNRVKMAAVMGSARGYVGTCSDEGSTLRACRSDSTRTIYPARLMYFPGVETRFRDRGGAYEMLTRVTQFLLNNL